MMIKNLCAALFIFTAVSAVQASDVKQVSFTKQTLVLEQRTAVLEQHPNIQDGDAGHTVYFEGELYYPDHKRAGILYGSTIAVGVAKNDGEHEIRHRELIFVVDDSQIITSGVSGYSEGAKWTNHGYEWHALDLAIIGGTGKYVGALGSMKSKKLKNNTFEHTRQMYVPVLP